MIIVMPYNPCSSYKGMVFTICKKEYRVFPFCSLLSASDGLTFPNISLGEEAIPGMTRQIISRIKMKMAV